MLVNMRSIIAAKYNVIRMPENDEPFEYKIHGFHTTLIDNWESIRRKGLIPGLRPPAGQTWKGDYSGKAIYLHQRLPLHEIDSSSFDDLEEPITLTIEVVFNIMSGYVVPDEEFGKPEDTQKIMKQKGPIAVAIRIKPNTIKALHLPDTEGARVWATENSKRFKTIFH